jgi:hypothetical protein
VETVPETGGNSFDEQEKQPKEQVETPQNEPQIEEKKGFFKRLLVVDPSLTFKTFNHFIFNKNRCKRDLLS